MSLHPEDTPEGCLPPFEVAKAYAFHVALEAIEEHLGKPAYALLGKRANSWIAEQLHVKGGGSPAERTVQQVVAKCKEPGWYPGQTKGTRALFQANNDIHTLGDSCTGAYSYDVWLWRVPIVVTVDMTAAWDQAEGWIQANSTYVHLDRACWTERV